jgi:hypothetical protein
VSELVEEVRLMPNVRHPTQPVARCLSHDHDASATQGITSVSDDCPAVPTERIHRTIQLVSLG